jgi:hypothetical protein
VGELSDRRSNSSSRLEKLRNSLTSTGHLVAGKASVYVTGSYGRGEAGQFSDLDLFLVGKNRDLDGESLHTEISRLDEICIKADLIRAVRHQGLPEFSGDGEYLTFFSVRRLTKTLGTAQDDAANTFTARLLLLLESTPLLEPSVYTLVVGQVISAYWRDYAGREDRFMPGFLCNDILRFWRTLCINYEAGTERTPERKEAKGRLKNFKLRHSRLLTCFSGILYLLARYVQKQTVTPDDAAAMTKMTPTRRLEWLLEQSEFERAANTVMKLIQQYQHFLSLTNYPEEDLVTRLTSPSTIKEFSAEAHAFGDSMFQTLRVVGEGSHLFRLLVV